MIGLPLIGLSVCMGDPIVVICSILFTLGIVFVVSVCSVLFALGIVFAASVWVYALSRIIDLPGE